MRYQPPVNATPTELDPQPSYFDGNPGAGQKGAIPPAKSIEHPMREILAVIEGAGLTPSDSDLTQLLQAIQTIAAGAGGDAAVFAYNPVFPEIISNGGVCSVASSSGQVVLATGQQWIWRGGVLYNSSAIDVGDRTLSTVANKTYHMRWRFNAGSPTLALYDLADGGYNPGALAETDAAFDTTYDDMLIARVVTDGSNLPAVTALFNKNRLTQQIVSSGSMTSDPGANNARRVYTASWNLARTPIVTTTIRRLAAVNGEDQDLRLHPQAASWAGYGGSDYVNRYGTSTTLLADIAQALEMGFLLTA